MSPMNMILILKEYDGTNDRDNVDNFNNNNW